MDKIRDFLAFHNGDGLFADGTPAPGFSIALAEIQNGRKSSHWIWYVLPITRSSNAFGDRFALSDADHVAAYVTNATLRDHYVAMLQALSAQMDSGVPPNVLLATQTDASKALESARLFKNHSAEDETLYALTSVVEAQLKTYLDTHPRHARIASFEEMTPRSRRD